MRLVVVRNTKIKNLKNKWLIERVGEEEQNQPLLIFSFTFSH